MSSNPLLTMTETTPTVLWNDSANPEELKESITFGAVGATCNPVIAVTTVKADLPRWTQRIKEIAQEEPEATHAEIGWQVVREVSVDAAKLLEPAFDKYKGVNGRLSVQTDPRLYRSKSALVEQAVQFDALARNIIVKIPAMSTGIEAIEEATYRGVSINVTVSFTVPQAVAAAEAIERGLKRRADEGKDTSEMGPVVTIMVGRVDDWLKNVYEVEQLAFDPGHLEWAGVACFKEAYRIFTERGYRARLLSAGYRNTLQWSEFIGGEVVISPPFKWQQRFQKSGIEPIARMDNPVDPKILESLNTMPEFRKAYEENGMTVAEFDDFGATRKTMRQFLDADEDLDGIVRDVLIPAP